MTDVGTDPRAGTMSGLLAPGALANGPAAPQRPTGGGLLTLEEAAAALRAIPYGGTDDGSRSLRLPPEVQATVSPVIAAIRWGSVMVGMVYAIGKTLQGDFDVVLTLTVVLFLTIWRTLRPVRLASDRSLDRYLAISDSAIVGLAIGWSLAFDSPFIFCILATAAVGAFGWGLVTGLTLLAVSTVAIAIGSFLTSLLAPNDLRDGLWIVDARMIALLCAFGIVTAVIAFARERLLEAETNRVTIAGQLDMLTETNDLLHILNQVARTLPTSLDMREATDSARDQIRQAFDAQVVALVVYDDVSDEWIPQITDGCALRPSSSADELPVPLADALASEIPILRSLGGGQPGVSDRSGSGIYTAVKARDRVIGVLGVEHRDPDRYGERDLRIMDGLSDVLALTVDNARSFRRLRALGAEEERSRIARDLHDRLGQWLSYISFELERIIGSTEIKSPELDNLYGDVGTAIDELRETLNQLRSEVTAERPLAAVAQELIDRFNNRGDVQASFVVTNSAGRLPAKVENEFLRILQEALSNIRKHAQASAVEVTYDVRDGQGELVIADDGRGFDAQSGIRDSAYGLKGMRERAESVEARISVRTAPGLGTEIRVLAGNALEETTV